MENNEDKLSARGLRIVSNVIVSFFALVSLVFFLFFIDRSLPVEIISLVLLVAGLYLMWKLNEFDSISLLIFFFGTTACFYFFSDVIIYEWPKAVAISVFALLSLILVNYLLNVVKPVENSTKIFYKIALAIIFTEIFWVLNFFQASQVTKGAITAVIFFNLLSVTRDVLADKTNLRRFAFLAGVSIILLAVVFIRI